MLLYDRCQMMRFRNGRRKLAGNTWLFHDGGDSYRVEFHGSQIVIVHPDGTYTVNPCGHKTTTTKARINEYSPARIYQKNFQWYFGDGQEVPGAWWPTRILPSGKPMIIPSHLEPAMRITIKDNFMEPSPWAVAADWLEERGLSDAAVNCRTVYSELLTLRRTTDANEALRT